MILRTAKLGDLAGEIAKIMLFLMYEMFQFFLFRSSSSFPISMKRQEQLNIFIRDFATYSF